MSKVVEARQKGKFSWFTVLLIAVLSFITIVPALQTAHAASRPFTHRLVFANIGMTNKVIDTCLGRMRAAASLGYNGYVTTNWEDNHLENVGTTYINNVKRVASEAKKLGITLIPRHFYQGDAVHDDYGLAEAFPVRGTRFKVANGEARSITDPVASVKNGGFESGSTGWQLINMPSAAVENSGAKAGNACLRISGGSKYARIKQRVTLKPFRAYKLSAWISTKGVSNWAELKFVVTGSGPLLNKRYRPFGTPKVWTTVGATQGWRLSVTDFNSLGNTSASLEFAVSDPRRNQTGTVWIDDIKLEDVGLYETVRRSACPIVVKSLDGTKTYKEGVDYTVDPKCNTFTDNSWNYQGHLKIPTGSAIQNGQDLSVDWYQMTDVEQIHPEANFCLPETRDAFKDNLQRMDALYGHDDYMYLGFDEWRVAFWDDKCQLFPQARTAGDYMAGALKTAHDLAWTTSPTRELYVWNDMYDPYFNAWYPYAMTNGGCLNSWKDMDTNIVMINWRPGPKWDEMSLRFYMGIDDSLNPEGKVWRQILNVMDGSRVISWLNMVERAEAQGGRGVIGINYVDWYANYGQMAAVKNACLAKGRWGSGPLPKGRYNHVSNRTKNSITKAATDMTVAQTAAHNMHIGFHLEKDSKVNLQIVDLKGRRVQTLTNRKIKAGQHNLEWNASSLSAGIYFINMNVDGITRNTAKYVIL